MKYKNYEFKLDSHNQWVLTTFKDGKDKEGNHKVQSSDTYHPTLSQVANAIIKRECGKCEELEELLSVINKTSVELLELNK